MAILSKNSFNNIDEKQIIHFMDLQNSKISSNLSTVLDSKIKQIFTVV